MSSREIEVWQVSYLAIWEAPPLYADMAEYFPEASSLLVFSSFPEFAIEYWWSILQL
jgi:hypothetical protein